jgi:hypothetical protein
VQVQEESERLAEFQDYYVRNRQMQLNSDLGSGGASPESYQPFLLQVAGNFLLEERVRRTCPSLSAGSAVRSLFKPLVVTLFCPFPLCRLACSFLNPLLCPTLLVVS